MQQQNNHIKPVADPELIRRYLAGELDNKAMNALERQALDDPFLAEALEGFEQHAPDQRMNLADLGKRLEQRVQEPAKNRVIPMYMRWAAVAAICLVVGSSIIWLWPAGNKSEIAKVTEKTDTIIPAEVSATVQVPESATMFKKEQGNNYRTYKAPVVVPAPMTAPLTEPQPQTEVTVASTPAPSISSAMVQVPAPAITFKDSVDEIASQNNYTSNETAVTTLGLKRAATSSFYDQNLIKGRVLNIKGDSGLAGVNVSMGAVATVTNYEGYFSLPNNGFTRSKKMGSNQLVTAFASGYESKSQQYSGDAFVRMQLRRTTDTTTTFGSNNDPSPVGGFEKFEIYLTNNVQYPAGLTVSGRVRVQFYVQPDGSLTDFRVLKKLQSECDQEAIRVIKTGPVWLPAANGKAVKVKVDVRFTPEAHQ